MLNTEPHSSKNIIFNVIFGEDASIRQTVPSADKRNRNLFVFIFNVKLILDQISAFFHSLILCSFDMGIYIGQITVNCNDFYIPPRKKEYGYII